MHVYFTIPRSVVTLLRYVSIELKELLTYLLTYLLQQYQLLRLCKPCRRERDRRLGYRPWVMDWRFLLVGGDANIQYILSLQY